MAIGAHLCQAMMSIEDKYISTFTVDSHNYIQMFTTVYNDSRGHLDTIIKGQKGFKQTQSLFFIE